MLIAVIVILILLYFWNKTKSISKIDNDPDGSGNSVMGCTSNLASNYNSLATQEDGSCVYPRQACCNVLSSDYDPTCDGDISCQCSESQCTLITSIVTQGMRTSCCSAGSTNYDSTCASDPFCNCENSICQVPASAHLCHSACNSNGGYNSILTTLPCGTGAVSNYPYSVDPYCNTQSA